MNAREIFARLQGLRDRAGALLFERLTLADKLLSDHEWVADASGGGGDEGRAIDRLEDLCFADICGALSLPEMLEVLRHVPQESVWKQNRYNLRKMHAEMKARQQAQAATSKMATTGRTTAGIDTQDSEQAQATVSPRSISPEDEVKRLRAELKVKDARIRQLEKDNRRLRKAVRKLQEAISNLQPA